MGSAPITSSSGLRASQRQTYCTTASAVLRHGVITLTKIKLCDNGSAQMWLQCNIWSDSYCIQHNAWLIVLLRATFGVLQLYGLRRLLCEA
ncbi:uncharacterized [Tachysurus ichikawai]